jgi:PAS domain S-box-containing protein
MARIQAEIAMPIFSHIGPREPAGRIWKSFSYLSRAIGKLRVSEKISAIVGLLVLVMVLLVVMSMQTVRLQSEYRRALATSTTTAINIGRVNALIYAIVMESRGIYMSTEPGKVKRYADELLRRNRELAGIIAEWEKIADFKDEARFPAFRERILQFIDFRAELARRATQISPAAGRAWGDNDANRSLRIALNNDIEALAKQLDDRALLEAELADRSQMASWYLALLGLCGLLLTALNVIVVRRSVIAPLSDIAQATDLIAAGKTDIDIPHVTLWDEIGYLARAVRNFRDATDRNRKLEQLEIGTARQRDTALGQRDRLNDKYLETKWQLSAALNNMVQGLIMIDAKGRVLMTNRSYRAMYQLPQEIIGPDCTLRDLLAYRAENSLFQGDIDKYMAAILERIAKGRPSVTEVALPDGRLIRISEQPMAGGGWVATHEDFTEQRRTARILERTERLLVTVLENIPQAIVAKDARSLHYTFVNKAAERLLGLPRAQIIGRSVRDLFPAETADKIERQDAEVLAGHQEGEFVIRTVSTPNNGQRLVAVRRLPIADQASDSRMLINMIEDRTDRPNVADVAA